MNRRSAIALISVVAAAVVLAYSYFDGEDDWAYLTAPVERGRISVVVSASGTLRPVSQVKVGSQLSGQIGELFADFNDKVQQGQLLARLDSEIFAARVRELQAALDMAQSNVLIQEAAISKAESELVNTRSKGPIAKAQTTRARALYEEAQRDLQRKRTLKKKNTISGREVDKAQTEFETAAADLRAADLEQQAREAAVLGAEAALKMAEAKLQNARAAMEQQRATLEQAEIELRRTAILAPIDGVVIDRNVDSGQTVAASLEAPTLFTVAKDLGRMEVHAKIDEADIGHIRQGQRATFTVDAFPGRIFTGAVVQTRKAPQRIEGVVTYTVLISTENPDFVLLPGMTATVHVEIQLIEDALKIPNAALRFLPPDASVMVGAGPHVWVLRKDASLLLVEVRLGASDATSTQVVSGLDEGQQVVVGLAPGNGDSDAFSVHIGY